MIIESKVITDLHIHYIDDLYKLKPSVQEGILKVNKTQISRELGIDRRTVDKYSMTLFSDYFNKFLFIHVIYECSAKSRFGAKTKITKPLF
jgi:hypothetical protein